MYKKKMKIIGRNNAGAQNIFMQVNREKGNNNNKKNR